MARSWSIWRTTALWTSCRTVRPPASWPGWDSTRRSLSAVVVAVTSMRRAFAGGPLGGAGGLRFHLVQNLRQALETFLLDHRPVIKAAAVCTAMALTPTASPVPVPPMYRGRRRNPKPTSPPEQRPPRHARWVAIYEAVHTFRAQGTPIAAMARQLNISRPTLYAYLRRDAAPGPRRLQRRPSARVLTPYVPYPIRRWRESGADSRQLRREIQALGYTHSARTVCRFITQLRRAADAGQPRASQRSPYTHSGDHPLAQCPS
jgi:hypothetical protein